MDGELKVFNFLNFVHVYSLYNFSTNHDQQMMISFIGIHFKFIESISLSNIIFNRVKDEKVKVAYPPEHLGRYKTFKHGRDAANPER